ncbi:MAG: hypothetical protein ACK452_06010 [Bacteroidota bacterium]
MNYDKNVSNENLLVEYRNVMEGLNSLLSAMSPEDKKSDAIISSFIKRDIETL